MADQSECSPYSTVIEDESLHLIPAPTGKKRIPIRTPQQRTRPNNAWRFWCIESLQCLSTIEGKMRRREAMYKVVIFQIYMKPKAYPDKSGVKN
ncbi:transcriptional regulator family: Fungal Specific TF [Penicillium psychrosexuale]|uniref:transcriptional regulator family: Fungal Specific TF n=1 Tax=Penicillium psychrosexuale TaxID=1002107 RepID=UPI0025450701|nr:transcriptional regulator family: Fungal Specific TF [Penicillium psychrosexuale]KAJ5800550.1 transcriptional regulator family: Fungal Specific TF [Penicillium psychrosexuale]